MILTRKIDEGFYLLVKRAKVLLLLLAHSLVALSPRTLYWLNNVLNGQVNCLSVCWGLFYLRRIA